MSSFIKISAFSLIILLLIISKVPLSYGQSLTQKKSYSVDQEIDIEKAWRAFIKSSERSLQKATGNSSELLLIKSVKNIPDSESPFIAVTYNQLSAVPDIYEFKYNLAALIARNEMSGNGNALSTEKKWNIAEYTFGVIGAIAAFSNNDIADVGLDFKQRADNNSTRRLNLQSASKASLDQKMLPILKAFGLCPKNYYDFLTTAYENPDRHPHGSLFHMESEDWRRMDTLQNSKAYAKKCNPDITRTLKDKERYKSLLSKLE